MRIMFSQYPVSHKYFEYFSTSNETSFLLFYYILLLYNIVDKKTCLRSEYSYYLFRKMKCIAFTRSIENII